MHRDLKADNALFTADWDTRALASMPDGKSAAVGEPIVKIIDFDSATTLSRTLHSGDRGHLFYIAPECRLPIYALPSATSSLTVCDRQ